MHVYLHTYMHTVEEGKSTEKWHTVKSGSIWTMTVSFLNLLLDTTTVDLKKTTQRQNNNQYVIKAKTFCFNLGV